jgi:hypothetical protein
MARLWDITERETLMQISSGRENPALWRFPGTAPPYITVWTT